MRPIMSIIGSGGASCSPAQEVLAEQLGLGAIDAGFRICCGGRDGVMEAACRGARSAPKYREGDTIGILPGADSQDANPFVDIVIPTGMGHARNVMVVMAGQVVVAVAGGAGTLSELALAWQLGRPIIALSTAGGWASKLAGQGLDDRRAAIIWDATHPAQAVSLAWRLCMQGHPPDRSQTISKP